MTTINFRFEHYKPCSEKDDRFPVVKNMQLGNLIGVPIARLSQIAEMMITFSPNISVDTLDSVNPLPYIFSTALCYSPPEWTDYQRDMSIFEYLPHKVIQDLRFKKALLLLDQSVEGYSAKWLWDWFHKKCVQYNISPKCIIYVTGDQKSTEDYHQWCLSNQILEEKLLVIPSTVLFHYVKRHVDKHNINITFDEILAIKTNSPPKYLFDCFMLRPRPHRILNYLHLLNSKLITFGNIGMQNIFEWNELSYFCSPENLNKFKLPVDIIDRMQGTSTMSKIEHTNHQNNLKYSDYAERILTSMYENSWVTQVVETTFFDHESLFISEKSIKPMTYMQPFVTLGSKGTLNYLKKLGFQTFHPIIDESYDEEENEGERLAKIMVELTKIKNHPNKIFWLKSLEPVLTHNYRMFKELDFNKSLECLSINKYYTDYFKEFDVS